MLCILASLDAILDDDVYGAGGVESLLSSLEGQLCEAEDRGVTEVSTGSSFRLHSFPLKSPNVVDLLLFSSFSNIPGASRIKTRDKSYIQNIKKKSSWL